MGLSYKPVHERGVWYELKCVRENIAIKEAQGKDASFEQELYRVWLLDPEFLKVDKENQRQGIYNNNLTVRKGGE